MLVVMRNAFSMNGRMPRTINPPANPAAPAYRQLVATNDTGSSATMPCAKVATIIAIAVTPPTSINLLRLRMSSSMNAAVIAPTQRMMKKPIP